MSPLGQRMARGGFARCGCWSGMVGGTKCCVQPVSNTKEVLVGAPLLSLRNGILKLQINAVSLIVVVVSCGNGVPTCHEQLLRGRMMVVLPP